MRPVCDAKRIGALPELDELGVRLSLRVGMARAGLSGLALVVAGAESAPGAGQDDDADAAIGVGLVEAPVQLGFELVRERVHALGPIERDGRDLIRDLIAQLLAHSASSRCLLPS